MGGPVLLVRKKAARRESLAKRILDSFDGSTFDSMRRPFLPENCLNDLITINTIREELKLDELDRDTYSKEWQELFTEWIHTQARKVFAITVQCGLPWDDTFDAMQLFREQDFEDKLLPIEDPRSLTDTLRKRFDSEIWFDVRLYDFYEKQWKCLCPVFSPEKYDYDLSPECIFPFTILAGVHTEGAFSSVYKVKIHDAHQEHDDIDEVAIKEIKISKANDKGTTEKLWEKEAQALEAINQLNHPHIVKCLAAIRRGDSRYFMFPWADGESLRDYWEKVPKQVPTEEVIEQTIRQLRGVADALDHLHNFHGGDAGGHTAEEDQDHPNGPQVSVQNEVGEETNATNKESIRHGDLKPENILRFNGFNGLGVLKVADMGLAKRHVVATQDRPHVTSTRFGTIRYEAPETETAIRGRSRLYDIWSMGCITLEFIIWILYGNDELKNFYEQLKGNTQQISRYYEIPATGERAEIHSVVLRWMKHVEEDDPECQQESATRDLLEIVRTKLLVVPLPPNRPTSEGGLISPGPALAPPAIGEDVTRYRATAREFRDALDSVIRKFYKRNYVLTGKGRQGIKTPQPKPKSNDLLSANAAAGQKSRVRGAGASGMIKTAQGDYRLPPLKDWDFPVDEAFAEQIQSQVGSQALRPRSSKPATLCEPCKKLNFWTPGFAFEYKVADIAARSNKCEFCKMLLEIVMSPDAVKGPKVRFERTESTLIMTGGEPLPVLSIFRSPELRTPLPIQLGFPELPEPKSSTFDAIIKLWLQDCDKNHSDCKVPKTSLPTRLIDVGTASSPVLRLLETRSDKVENTQYIALSHPWGDPKIHPPFCTLRTDDTGRGRTVENFKRKIPYGDLSATFKDAVDMTRALNVRYLWIDSICIIQGKDGDFNDESKRMEDVFSGAYCVLAASRALGQTDGFLKPRPQRDYITFQRGNEKPFYVCEPIDNFSEHVLEGSLNRRGWVLQERALARRTVFFTETQTYFECGAGVRCETLARMHNNMADFLGDPNFPSKAMRSTRGLKIRYFQDLYQLYSRLGFSHIEDRPWAIAGLEKRLISAYDTKGGYGIFDGNLFHRSLLWQRGEDEASLTPIVFPLERNVKVPSWSWMAYKGGIDYLEPPFDGVDWEDKEIHAPWTGGGHEDTSSAHEDGGLQLIATVRNFDVKGRRADEVRLVYDDTERSASDGQRPQCVIVARSKDGKTEKEKRCYVLIVMPMVAVGARGEKMYRRIGAGFMLGKYITDLGEKGISARIQ